MLLSLGCLKNGCSAVDSLPSAAALLARAITSSETWNNALRLHPSLRNPSLVSATATCSTTDHASSAVADTGTSNVIPSNAHRSFSAAPLTRMFSTTPSSSSQSSGEQPGSPQIHLLKCRSATHSPVSQAVAMMLSQDQIPRDQLLCNLEVLAGDLLDTGLHSCSTTELSAFCEVFRQVRFTHIPVFWAITSYLAHPQAPSHQQHGNEQQQQQQQEQLVGVEISNNGTTKAPSSSSSSSSSAAAETAAAAAAEASTAAADAAPLATSMQVDELPSILWAAARLMSPTPDCSSSFGACADATDTPGVSLGDARSDTPGDTSGDMVSPVEAGVGESNSSSSSSSGSSGSGREGVAREMVGLLVGAATQALSGDLEGLTNEELTVVVQALADVEHRDPFIMTALAEAATSRAADFTPSELVALISGFADMARWYYDAQLLDKLAEAVAAAAGHFDGGQLAAVEAALKGIKHKHNLQA